MADNPIYQPLPAPDVAACDLDELRRTLAYLVEELERVRQVLDSHEARLVAGGL